MALCKKFSFAVLALIVAASMAATASAALSDFQDTGIYWSSGNYDLYYAFYDPFFNTTPPAGEKFPLLIYLHGSGNGGRDISGPASHPNASMLVGNAKKASTKAFVIIPQSHSSWSASDGAVLALREMIAEYAAVHPIDLTRIYYTGFSLGGLGVFSIESAYPNEIAFGGPMAGALWESDNVTKATNRGSVATWAFSGNIDGTVPPADAQEALEPDAYYGGHPLFTIYSSTGHNDTWQRVNALDQDGLISFMFAQQVGQPQDESMFLGWPINSTETLVLDGPGDSAVHPLDYFVGYYGRGDLGLYNGATVTSRKGYISANGGSRGNVVIDGAGSAWTCSDQIFIGANNGLGSLHVANGGSMSGTYMTITQYSFLSGNGQLNLTELRNEGTIDPGDIATTVEPGPQPLTYGGRFVAPVALGGASALDPADYLDALGDAGADATGVLTLNGLLRLYAKSVLNVDIEGAGVGEFDAINATGTAYVAGKLNISLSPDFKPADGQEFDIVTGSVVSGTFATVTGTSNANGTLFTVVYDSNSVKLKAKSLKPGDIDGDGAVDIWDFTFLKYYYGQTNATWSMGDFNGDKVVDIQDFVILKKNYGS